MSISKRKHRNIRVRDNAVDKIISKRRAILLQRVFAVAEKHKNSLDWQEVERESDEFCNELFQAKGPHDVIEQQVAAFEKYWEEFYSQQPEHARPT